MSEQNAPQTAGEPRPKAKVNKTAITILAVFLVVGLIAAFTGYTVSRAFFATTGVLNVGNAPPVALNGTEAEANGEQTGTEEPAGIPTIEPMVGGPTPVPWDGKGQVNILVMGLDYRDWIEGHDVPRTDTMILFQMDTVNKTAGMLAIPRDMWVNIPGFGYSTINTAYPLGVGSRLPGGGPGLAMKTVEHFIGMPVDYYALIDFNSFVRFIDHLGGLKFKITEPIKIDPIGPANTVILEPGVQTIPGSFVLAYARMRYTQDGDFDRSSRQMEVIMSLRDRVIQLDLLPGLIAKAPVLYDELASGINTNLSLEQVIQLAWSASQIDRENIKQGVFDPHTDVGYASTMLGGNAKDVLIPVPDRIRTLRDRVFVQTGPYDPSTSGSTTSSADLMKSEAAKVLMRNGTGRPDLSTVTADKLRGEGMNLVGEQAADQNLGATTIKDYTGKPYTIRYLMETLNIPNARIVNSFDPASPIDVEVIIGSDWAAQN